GVTRRRLRSGRRSVRCDPRGGVSVAGGAGRRVAAGDRHEDHGLHRSSPTTPALSSTRSGPYTPAGVRKPGGAVPPSTLCTITRAERVVHTTAPSGPWSRDTAAAPPTERASAHTCVELLASASAPGPGATKRLRKSRTAEDRRSGCNAR